jgi:hypothetical protein
MVYVLPVCRLDSRTLDCELGDAGDIVTSDEHTSHSTWGRFDESVSAVIDDFEMYNYNASDVVGLSVFAVWKNNFHSENALRY